MAPLEAGRVAALHVEIGDTVTTGQSLLALESKLVELEVQGAAADVEVAEVNLKEAERLYQEAQRLSAQNVIAKTVMAERAATLAAAKAQLANLKARLNIQQEVLNRHQLKAPFDGVIAQRSVDLGEWVTPQTPVLTLVAQDDLRLAVEIPQQYYSQLRAYQHTDIVIKVSPDIPGAEPFDATLSRLVPVSNAVTRTFAAQIDLPDNPGLVAGMSARVNIIVPESVESQIILPRSAIKQHPDGGSSVFVVDNNLARRVVTAYSGLSNNLVAIPGKAAEHAYIISGVELLKEGTPVRMNVVTAPEINHAKGQSHD